MKTWINVLLANTSLLLAAMLLGSMFGGARAQNFPHKPVKIVVAASPGTSLDILSRLLGNELSSRLGQMFVVENMPGAGGNIATVNVANAPADGYTLLMQISSFAINPSLYKKVPYDPIKQFQPVILAAWTVTILAVGASAEGINSVKDLIAASKSQPGKLNYTSPGYGTPPHVRMEIFKYVTGANLTHIAYKTPSDMIRALYVGDATAVFNSSAWILPAAKAGKLKSLAVLTRERWPQAPELPTMAEVGFPEFKEDIWLGFFAPAGSPREIVYKLNSEFATVLRTSAMKDSLAKQGLIADSSTPEAFSEIIKTDLAHWSKMIKQTGITVD